MKIYVINASPKTKYSVTYQTVEFLIASNPDDEFKVIHVGNKVKKYSSAESMDECLKEMQDYDVILFVYPVYTFLAPYQLAQFINNMKSRPGVKNIEGKFASQITTSKHFYDVTAHKYIKDNCDDMKMKSITGLAADMDDLVTEYGIKNARDFFKYVKFSIQNNSYLISNIPASKKHDYVYSNTVENISHQNGFDTVIVTDCKEDDFTLRQMINNFKSVYKYKTREVNIADFKFTGGCLGCFECATDGKCIYKDGFENMLRDEVQNADVVILAAKIIDHSLGPVFKCYDDRQFCNGHRVLTNGKSIAYILDGCISVENNLQVLIEARSDVSHMYLAGTASSESENSDKITSELEKLAASIAYAMENKLTRPQSFYGVGGMKIFRDLIYVMRGLMKEDHAFYKKHSIYNFPQKQRGLIFKMKFVGFLMSIPSIKKKSRGMMNDIILKPYKEVIENERSLASKQ